MDPSSSVLYSDKYFTVTKTDLIIKNYYFPICTAKIIPLADIISINTDRELDLRWYDRKMWGMPLNKIWYAMDWGRHIYHHISCIIKVKDDKVRKGFTLIDENGLEILKKAWNDETLAIKSVIS